MVPAQDTPRPKPRRLFAKEPMEQQADENGASGSVAQNLNKLHLGSTTKKPQKHQHQSDIMRESNTLKGKVVKQKTYEAKAKKRQQMLERLAAEDKEKLTRDAIIKWLDNLDPNPEPIVDMELGDGDADEVVAEHSQLNTNRESSSFEGVKTNDKEEYDEEMCKLKK